jgi:uncharacterized protein YjeT (DUF2065 family)
MEQVMTKNQLDKWGGVGSVAAGVMCVWFAQRHDPNDYMWKVWLVMCVLLVLNGIAMLVYANRPKGPGKPVDR